MNAWDLAALIYQRHDNGEFTNLAMALQALEDQGCDCGTDEPGTCLACVCECALREQWERVEKLREALRDLLPCADEGAAGCDTAKRLTPAPMPCQCAIHHGRRMLEETKP